MFCYLVGYISRQGQLTIIKCYQDYSSCIRYIKHNNICSKPNTFYILPFVICDNIKESGVDWEGVEIVNV